MGKRGENLRCWKKNWGKGREENFDEGATLFSIASDRENYLNFAHRAKTKKMDRVIRKQMSNQTSQAWQTHHLRSHTRVAGGHPINLCLLMRIRMY